MIADEVQHDLYGYTRHELDDTRRHPVVVPVRFTDEADAYDGFLRALGLTGAPEPGGYSTYLAHGGGEVGVHYVYGEDLPVVESRYATVHLTFAVDRPARRAGENAAGQGVRGHPVRRGLRLVHRRHRPRRPVCAGAPEVTHP